MQNVATGKSELAALPLLFNSDPSAVIEDSSEFKSLLQDASDKNSTQPVAAEEQETTDKNQLNIINPIDERVPEKAELQDFEERPEVRKHYAGKNQIDSDLIALQNESEQLAVDADNKSKSIIVNVSDVSSDLNTDLDSIIPVIDLLDLLEQSQFKEITISSGQKADIKGQVTNIQELVEHLQALSDQSAASADGPKSESMNAVLNKFIATLDEQNIESDSPIKLTELLAKIQSDLELQNNTKSLPSIESDEQEVLDIELISVIVAQDQDQDQDQGQGHTQDQDHSTTEIKIMTEVQTAPDEKETADPLQQITNVQFDNDLVEQSAVVIVPANAVEDLESPQLVREELIEQSGVRILPDEMKNLSQYVESKVLRQILTLSPEKLDKALENLANRIIQVDSAVNQDTENQTKLPSTTKQDFIASLKISIDEIKTQLNQGKQIDSNLKSVVIDSLNPISQEINPDTINATISRFSQTLELSSTLLALAPANLPAGLETSTVDRVLAKETQTQSDLLQVKQGKQQVVQFEKAVNIIRSEGQNQLVEKVRWMVNQNTLQADIRLDPPDLGAMKVRVSLSGETASVNIVVQSQQAKDLLDSAAPKLRDLLQEQGIQLGQSSVEQEQRHRDDKSSALAGGSSDLSDEPEPEAGLIVTEQTIINGQLSGIDYFV